MNNESIYSKLTPSAKKALDELTEGYRNSLIENAYIIAKERDTANKEVSLRDILEAEQPIELSIKRKSEYLDYKRRRSLILISFSGAVYAILGILLYLYQNKKFSIETDLGLIIAIIGGVLAIVAFLYGQLLSIRQQFNKKALTDREVSKNDNYDIVRKWQIIEQLTTSIMKSRNVSDAKYNAVNQVIRYLTENFATSERDYVTIRELLQTRNKILHEGITLSENEKKHYIEIADNLIDKLGRAEEQIK